MLSSHVLINLVGLVTTMLTVRALGPAEYGDLTFVLAYLGFCLTLTESSLSLTIMRKASQAPSQLGDLLGNGLVLQGVLAIVVFGVGTAVSPLLGYNPTVTRLLRLSLLILLLSPFSLFRLIFLVTQKIKLLAVLDLVVQLSGFLLTLLVIRANLAHATSILWVQVANATLTAIYYLYSRHHLSLFTFRLNWQVCSTLIRDAWPLSMTTLLLAVQIHIGRLIIGHQLSNTEGGYYATATRLAFAIQFIPTAYFASVYPLLAHYHLDDFTKFRWLYRLSYKSLMIFILPIALLATLTSRALISFYAGFAYLNAAPLFAWFIWLQVFHYAGLTLYYMMLAANQHTYFPKLSIIQTILHVAILQWLLPRIGLTGSALTVMLVHLILFSIYILIKDTRQYIWDWLYELSRPLLAIIILGIILTNLHLSPLLIWLVGLSLYGFLLFILGGMSWLDRQLASNIFAYLLRKVTKPL